MRKVPNLEKSFEELVQDELDYYMTYSRQHGELAAWQVACDNLVKAQMELDAIAKLLPDWIVGKGVAYRTKRCIQELESSLAANAKVLARQGDLAREAEMKAMEAEARVKELETVIQRKCRWCDLIGECGEKDCPLWPYHKKEGDEQDA